MAHTDPFDSILDLESTLYTSAYALGKSDGSHAGRIEGRIFGLEKGFEKFAALGRLHGRSVVWGARLPVSSQQTSTPMTTDDKREERADVSGAEDGIKGGENDDVEEELRKEERDGKALPPLPSNARLARHISTLHGLTDPLTFSTLNIEDAVADHGSRYKAASAKAKIIERIVGESNASSDERDSPSRVKGSGTKKDRGDEGMEDFSFEVR